MDKIRLNGGQGEIRMKHYYTKQSQCEKFGHDYAIQDLGNWMAKVCLRCGQQVFFWPADEEDEE